MRLLAAVLLMCASGCGDSSVPSPFQSFAAGGSAGAGQAVGAAGRAGAPGGRQTDTVGSAGQPSAPGAYCLHDQDCEDPFDCTSNRCDAATGRCEFEPDDALCADGRYCNGIERCDARLGCSRGAPVTCSDDNPCTIDRCDEATRSCHSLPRDLDSDGDPDLACGGGGDCNDTDEFVSSLAPEVCDNGQDDDCDQQVDETDCERPAHDTCADPLEISAGGSHELLLAAARGDYAASCAGGAERWRDVVVALVIEQGPVNVDLTAMAASGELALAGSTQCGDASSEIGCSEPGATPSGTPMSRLVLRELDAGTYSLYLFSRSARTAVLRASFSQSEPRPLNETCGTASSLLPGDVEAAFVGGADEDHSSRCKATTGELTYTFSLAAPQDVSAFAASLDGYGVPSLSLLASPCTRASDEIICHTADPATLFFRSLAAGTYTLAVSATGPTEVSVGVELDSPSRAPEDERCTGAPPLEPNTTVGVPLNHHTDDIHTDCLAGAVDAAYALELDVRADVRLVARLSDGDTGAVAIARSPCTEPGEIIACSASDRSPARVGAGGLEPGSYRALVEADRGGPVQATALVRPSMPPVLVAFADTCAEALRIPPTGGSFQGNTSNAAADYAAGCDSGSQDSQGGAPEQMLTLTLDTRKRVVLDMQGSDYPTLLDVRRGPDCPGAELPDACAAGYVADRSYLDLVLEAGDYFVQVDGYAGNAGRWVLDVFVVEP